MSEMSGHTPPGALDFIVAGDTPTAGAPIADLSYRNYDGPLHTRVARWWIVSLASLRLAVKKKGFWIAAAISILPYLIILLQLYLQSGTPVPAGANPLMDLTVGQRFASQFFQALGFQMFFLFIITLLVGSGVIAADNQSNALLVYLSKPLTKGDYLLGKWMGVFLILFGVAFIPGTILYVFCLLSYYSEGFLKNEPWLFARMTLAAATPAVIHASLITGFSAWSKSPRVAGALYAGLYFIGNIVVGATWAIRHRGNLGEGVLERHLSVEGVINGLAQNLYGVVQKLPTYNQRTNTMERLSIDPPSMMVMLLMAAAFVVVGVGAARMRIRAVEIVKG